MSPADVRLVEDAPEVSTMSDLYVHQDGHDSGIGYPQV
jgi:hypothetical protein